MGKMKKPKVCKHTDCDFNDFGPCLTEPRFFKKTCLTYTRKLLNYEVQDTEMGRRL